MAHVRPIAMVSTLAIAALACATSTDPHPVLVATVVAAGRDSAGSVYLEVNWRNVGTVPVYVPGCGHRVSMWLDRHGIAGWDVFGGGICPANLDQSPIRVDPDASVPATVRVGSGSSGDYRAVTSASDVLGDSGELVRSHGVHIK
jgi:hypothetical protein